MISFLSPPRSETIGLRAEQCIAKLTGQQIEAILVDLVDGFCMISTNRLGDDFVLVD